MNSEAIAITFVIAVALLLAGLIAVTQWLNSRVMPYYTVHVYYVGKPVSVSHWKNLDLARNFADRMFSQATVYKVKIWKGEAVPNVEQHPDLIYHLV